MNNLKDRISLTCCKFGLVVTSASVDALVDAIAPDVETTEGLSIQDWYLWMGMHCGETIEKQCGRGWDEVTQSQQEGFCNYRLKPKQKLPRKGSLPSWQHGPVCDAIEITSDVYIKIGDEYVPADEAQENSE